MALPECFAALTAIKSIPCEKSRLDEASRLALDSAIKIGRGGIWLYLTKEQYLALTETRN